MRWSLPAAGGAAYLALLSVFAWALADEPRFGARVQADPLGGRPIVDSVPPDSVLHPGDVVLTISGQPFAGARERSHLRTALPLNLPEALSIRASMEEMLTSKARPMIGVLRNGKPVEVPVEVSRPGPGALAGPGTFGLLLSAVLVAIGLALPFTPRPGGAAARIGSLACVLLGVDYLASSALDLADVGLAPAAHGVALVSLRLARGLVPFLMLHFALEFPRRHAVLARAPVVLPLYAIAAGLLFVEDDVSPVALPVLAGLFVVATDLRRRLRGPAAANRDAFPAAKFVGLTLLVGLTAFGLRRLSILIAASYDLVRDAETPVVPDPSPFTFLPWLVLFGGLALWPAPPAPEDRQ
ncbi:MAG: hypothetical protein FJ087_20255 [Deltaproteobacteria bacterium]|nr:hypothetical protein [Deltaproteobacteria bacterium]